MILKTVIFNYYDGPVEGLSILSDNKFYYFKLLAWDENQDQRLYFLSQIPKSDFDFIITLLPKDQEISRPDIWMPQCPNDYDERMVDNKIREFHVGESVYLTLTDNILDESLKFLKIRKTFTHKLNKTLNSENIASLSSWLTLLKK